MSRRSPLQAAPPILVALVVVACSSSPPAATQKPAPVAADTPRPSPEYFSVDPSTAAVLSGRILYQGPKPRLAKLRIDEDQGCRQLNKGGLLEETIVVNAGGSLANVFVYVKKGLEGKQFAPPPPEAMFTIDQNRCRFIPHVFGVRVGQFIRVTNSDPVTHNIHPLPKQNREWNQSQEPGAPPLERRFVRPEMFARVKCNVHAWMRAYVSVMEHPYFAVTGADGSFEIPNLPPGGYTIEAWQEQLGTQELQINLDPAARKAVTLTFSGATKAL